MVSDEVLSQEEIQALLRGETSDEDVEESTEISKGIEDLSVSDEGLSVAEGAGDADKSGEDLSDVLSDVEKDAIGEIGNISMGTAATTLSTLLGKKVNITTPRVSVMTPEQVAKSNTLPVVAIDVSWQIGLEGSNLMILQSNDVKIIADLMMGKTEGFDSSRELTDIDLSAVSEAMNQMMGSTGTSLSEMFNRKVDISPPSAAEITLEEGKDKLKIFQSKDPLVCIEFRMVVEDLLDTTFVQLIPVYFGKEMVQMLMGSAVSESTVNVEQQANKESQPVSQPVSTSPPQQPQQPQQQYQQMPPPYYPPQPQVMVSQPQFQSFDRGAAQGSVETIDLVGDIPVELSVELGRTNKKIGEILEFNEGTVIELNKLVGEALEIYANGKFIARGEVVVIDDSFGVRVTEIEKAIKI